MYRTNDGQPLASITPLDIVKELHKLSFSPADSDRAFMVATTDRVMLQTGKRVRSDSADHFVADLIEIGLLIEEAEDGLTGIDPWSEETADARDREAQDKARDKEEIE